MRIDLLVVLILVVTIMFALSALLDRIEFLEKSNHELQARMAELQESEFNHGLKLSQVQADVDKLSEKVEHYEQDIRFWNSQVDTMFGAANKRYFAEKRD